MLYYNSWASSNGTKVVRPQNTSENSFNVSSLGFFSHVFKATQCPITNYRLESVRSGGTIVDSAAYENVIGFNNETTVLTVANYSGVNPQMLGTTDVFI